MEKEENQPGLALELHDVRKVYRLYRKPVFRVMDLLGLCAANKGYYTEHAALNGVSLQIRRGEKVAIIGRNGAGKSTMLKAITRTIQPTSGRVDVHGKVSALLQIGTGFHPDFTGRQNAFAAMALQGITGREAQQKFEEIVDFAELEEYIEQPMKTYSTGMCARLMFSASIVVTPDMLVVDEVLGVGDAYFTHKSFDRMRKLCTGHGTTLLLVTHDIYSAMNLCDRFIWVDRGQVQFDGDAKTTVGRYESSIKQQEEDRLRHRAVISLGNLPSDSKDGAPQQQRFQVLFRSQTGFALDAPLALSGIDVIYDDDTRSKLDVAKGTPGWSLLPEGNLSEPEEFAGKRCRVLTTAGSIYHKAEWVMNSEAGKTPKSLAVRYQYSGNDIVDVRMFSIDKKMCVKAELPQALDWSEAEFPCNSGGELDSTAQTVFGTGIVRIVSVEYLDGAGNGLTRARHGEPLKLRITLDVSEKAAGSDVTFVVGFNRPGLPYGGYVVNPHVRLPAEAGQSELIVSLDPLLLGSGQWIVTYAVGEADLYGRSALPYFTVNDKWYHFVPRGSTLDIASTTRVDESGCFMVHPARFSIASAKSATQEPAGAEYPPISAQV